MSQMVPSALQAAGVEGRGQGGGALNADVVFIQTAMDSLIRDRSPAPGDTAALDKVADDAVYLSNRIFERLQAQLEEPTAAIES